MKKFLVFVIIIAISVGVGLGWTSIQNFVTELTHPMKYSQYVEKYSEEYSVPQEIIYAVIKCESSYEADVISSSGAVGLMQIMPSTFEDLCRRMGEEYNENLLYSPEVNIKYGTFYLSYLHSRYGVWETVFAAYNAGYGKVDSWLKDESASKDGRLIEIPYEETREYVKRVSDARDVYAKLISASEEKIQRVETE